VSQQVVTQVPQQVAASVPVAKPDFTALAAAFAAALSKSNLQAANAIPVVPTVRQPQALAKAFLSGGCFWGVEMVFDYVNGVSNSVSGYAGGTAASATYDQVTTGNTDHTETIEITYDPSQVTFKDLLRIFFAIHDPTTLNYQKPDTGRWYRSSVHYVDQLQKLEAEQVIREVRSNYVDSIVTEVVPLLGFYPAEEYHQDFARLKPTYGYIVKWDLEKLGQLRNGFPQLFNYTKMQDPLYRALNQAAFA
jgi:peptide-methionine (S)-S-oxide reductase